MTTLLALLCFGAANAEDGAGETPSCWQQATVKDELGNDTIDARLLGSCREAMGEAPVSASTNPFFHEGACPLAADDYDKLKADRAHECRLNAVYLDASGHPRVNRGDVRRCMQQYGYATAMAKKVATWADACAQGTEEWDLSVFEKATKATETKEE